MFRRFHYLARTIFAGSLLFLCLTGTSHAQYMYMDSNGDGISTVADRMQPNGTPTIVNFYVNTNHNKNGSLATCSSNDGDLGIWNSYSVNVFTPSGTVTFSSYVNRQPSFMIGCAEAGLVGFISNSTEMSVCAAGAAPEAGGFEWMFTITVTGQAGSPSLQFFAPYGNLNANPTSFGTSCPGNIDFDNTAKLGSDWFDADGVGPASSDDLNPVLTAPTTVDVIVDSPISVTATAADPDAGQLVTLSQTNNAPFLTGPASAGPTANPSITLSGTPSSTQIGSYTIHWHAADNVAPVPGTNVATTTLRVKPIDLAPTVTAPATASVMEGSRLTVVASATDPNGDPIGNLTATGTAIAAGATFTKNAANSSGTLSWTPSSTQSGSYSVTFTATNALTSSATTNITVTDINGPPMVTAPASVATTVNEPVSVTMTAADPDGEEIATLTAQGSAIATGGVFTGNSTNTAGTLNWTPSQTGDFSVTFTASNGLTGSATTVIVVTVIVLSDPTVTNLARNPSFETSSSGWSGLDGGIIQRVPGGFDGDYSLEVRGPAIGTAKFSVNDSPNWVLRAPAPGAVYRFTAWVRSTSSTGKAQLRVREYLAKVHQGTSYSRAVTLTPTWQMVTVDRAAIAQGSTLDLQVMDAPLAPGEVFQTDGISIVLVSGGSAVVASAGPEAVLAPNPLNPEATLAFTTSNAGRVQVRIFSASGRFVRTLVDEPSMEPGRHSVRFNGRDAGGQQLASGIYFYRIEADRRATTGRFTILK